MNATNVDEVLAFACDLYNYLWSRQKFRSPDFERLLTEPLIQKSTKTSEVESGFDEQIGKAVFNSQLLLRDYCKHFFQCIGNNLFSSDISFNLGVCGVILNYTGHSKNVFCGFIDSAAIVAESVLYCDANSRFFPWLADTPEIFTGFFITSISTDFFGKGGWDQLSKEIVQQYSQLNSILEPFVNSFKMPYEKLDWNNCELIKSLRESPIMFPIALTNFCEKCELPSDNMYLFYYDHSLFTLMEIASHKDKSCKGSLQKLLDVKKNYIKSKIEVPIEMDIDNWGRNRGQFLCMFIGKSEEYTKDESWLCDE